MAAGTDLPIVVNKTSAFKCLQLFIDSFYPLVIKLDQLTAPVQKLRISLELNQSDGCLDIRHVAFIRR